MTANNMIIWDSVSKTDPAHTKQFSRAGGFKGTALKPMWVVKRLTEQFGPCGDGWGMNEPVFTIVNGDNREVLVYSTVSGWYKKDGETKLVYGVGGDKAVSYIKANPQYNRAERWENDDEAFKKAFTDAIMNAFKFVGVGADIHMGQFDDNKYVSQLRQEFAANDATERVNNPTPAPKKAKPEKLAGPYTSKTALWAAVRKFSSELHGCGDSDMLEAFLADKDSIALLAQCERDAPGLLRDSDIADYVPLEELIARMRADFEFIENNTLRAG